jgi:predicted Fe-Mo cluster-binding NifX family protein
VLQFSAGKRKMAKIAIASNGKTLDSQVDPRFGRCFYFLIVDSKTGDFEVLPNTADNLSRGAGISAAQLVVDQKVEAVIAGNFGPKAVNVLSQSGVNIIPVLGKTAKQALKAYQTGKLKPVDASQVPSGRVAGFKGGWSCEGGKQS